MFMSYKNRFEEVYEILQIPIITSKTYYGPICKLKDCLGNEYILSGQTYNGVDDEDMCDFAIGFYKILYDRDILNINDENSKGEFVDKEFAGDTMIDNFKKEIANYHCLANFWILPMKIGRTSGKLNRSRMHADIFLAKLKKNFSEYLKVYSRFFSEFTEDEFPKYQYLENSYTANGWEKLVKITDVSDAKETIRKRAEVLAKEKQLELFVYFKGLGICKGSSKTDA